MERLRFKGFLILILLTFIPSKVLFTRQAIRLHFESLTINNGLSQGFVSCITQDKKGFMWFATGDGLNKYDGYKFTVYHHDPLDTASIGDDDITYVYEDSHERLWICTLNNGIDLFDRQNLRFIHIKHTAVNSLSSNTAYGITEDKTGILWIRTSNGIDAMKIIENKSVSPVKNNFFSNHTFQFTHIKLYSTCRQPEKNSHPPSFFSDSRGNNFITTCNGLYKVAFNSNGQTCSLLKCYTYNAGKLNQPADLLEDSAHHIYFLHCNDGVFTFSDASFTSPKLLYRHIEYNDKWTFDHAGSLWLSEQTGITKLVTASGDHERIVADNNQLSNFVKQKNYFYTDHTGVVWIGTSGYGILKYDPSKNRFHTIFPNQSFYRLFQSNSGNIVIKGSYEFSIREGVPVEMNRIIPEKIFKRFSSDISTANACEDKAGNLWVALKNCILKYNVSEKKATHYSFPFADKVPSITPLLMDDNNNLWIGLSECLLKFNTVLHTANRYAYLFKPDDNDFFQVLEEDKPGTFWLGTKNGLLLFNSKKLDWKYWLHKEQDTATLSNNFILSFCKDPLDPTRYLWIGTKGGGLNRLDKVTGSFSCFTTKNGLPNNVIYGILSDQHRNLWLSTNKGLCEFNPVTKAVRNFDVDDGLQGNEFNRYSYCKAKNNLLVFGGMNGINYFNPDDIQPLNPPEVVLTDFKLFNKSVSIKSLNSPLKKDIVFTSDLTLEYAQNMLTLQFAATDYRKTGSIHYRYKLKGFDKDWIYSGTGHEATYTNLNPGTYGFSVEASNSDNVWGNQPTNLTIHIIPAWWQTCWFYLLAAAAATSLVYLIYRYRINQLLRMQQVRNRIAQDLHDEIGSSLSTISIYSKVVQEQLKNTAHTSQPLLKKISENANEAQDAMNDIVWSINTKNDDFENISNRMREHSVQLLEAKNYTLHFSFDEDLFQTRFDVERRKNFYLVFKEALNNIAKYAEGKNVWISLAANHAHITLTIKDDGKGFDVNYNGKFGNGLHNMQSRALLLKGTITIDSEKGCGTTLCLNIPN